jgi:hypothetical protein
MGCLLILVSLVVGVIFPPLGAFLFLVGLALMIANSVRSGSNKISGQLANFHSPKMILKAEMLKTTEPEKLRVLQDRMVNIETQERRALMWKAGLGCVGVLVFLIWAGTSSHSSSSLATPGPSPASWQPSPTPTPESTPEATPTPQPTPEATPESTPEATPPVTSKAAWKAAEAELNGAWFALSQHQRNVLRADERRWAQHKDSLALDERVVEVENRTAYLKSLR